MGYTRSHVCAGINLLYFVTKIRIVFELAILSANIFLISMCFLINQIAKRGRKSYFLSQTTFPRKNDGITKQPRNRIFLSFTRAYIKFFIYPLSRARHFVARFPAANFP